MFSFCLKLKKLLLHKKSTLNLWNLMKTLVNTAFLLCLGLALSAQEGTINIEQDPKIEALIDVYKKVNSQENYYQIQVGFGSYQKAQNLKSQVEVDFPGWYSKIEFQEPTYRVRLGKFKDELLAQRKFLEVRKKYPNAMLLKPENSTK